MKDLIIRPARIDEIEILREFEQGVIAAERPFDATLKDGQILYYDLRKLIESPDAEVLVAEIDGALVGSGYALEKKAEDYLKHETYAYLGFMYVVPHQRGRGVNRAITDALLGWATKRGLTEIRLEVYIDNAAARKAYEKAGFTAHMLEMRFSQETLASAKIHNENES